LVVATTAAAPRRSLTCASRLVCGVGHAAVMAHHRTDAIHHQRSADDARRSRGRGPEKRATRRRLPHHGSHGRRLVGRRGAHRSTLATRPYRWDRASAWRLAAPEHALAHAFEEATLPRRLGAGA